MSEFQIKNNNNITIFSETVNKLDNQTNTDTNIELNGENNSSFSLQNINQQIDNLPIKDNFLTERKIPKNREISSEEIINQQDNKTIQCRSFDINKYIIEVNNNDINNGYNIPVPIVTNNQNNLYQYNLSVNTPYEIPYAQPIVNQNNQQELTIKKNKIECQKKKDADKCCKYDCKYDTFSSCCFFCCIEFATLCCLALFRCSR